MHTDKNIEAFFELVRAGLWPNNNQNLNDKHVSFKDVDWEEVYRLAEEQSVVGLIAAGMDKFGDSLNVPLELKLQIIGEALQIEQQNKEMNEFVARLIEKLRQEDVYAILVKGQGIAQCYEKPLWRSSGDVDLYLSKDNYEKAKAVLVHIAQDVEKEEKKRQHLGMTIDGFVVELHGTMHTKISGRMNRVSDEVHRDIFYHGNVRSWNNNGVQVFLPNANNDVIIIFNHFINHFFMEGVGLRQICDWCRLLYRYREEIDVKLLETRIRKAGLMTEWKAFLTLATKYLGLPEVSSFMFQDSSDSKWGKKADRIMEFVLESGNFGHNRDVSYRSMKQAAVVNAITFWRRFCDFAKFSLLFPVDSPRFFCQYLLNRITNVASKS